MKILRDRWPKFDLFPGGNALYLQSEYCSAALWKCINRRRDRQTQPQEDFHRRCGSGFDGRVSQVGKADFPGIEKTQNMRVKR